MLQIIKKSNKHGQKQEIKESCCNVLLIKYTITNMFTIKYILSLDKCNSKCFNKFTNNKSYISVIYIHIKIK